ncbi:flavin reductase (DIM6/NTAB) family NADH-FMN oxidoreductase RutF [Arthrobacter sp. V1I7]|uniref:flavin reductase family protein n=1 Tax=Arthrobacter sp. V1I7 TaxID=3042274 RepID=UPI00277ED586|nr:flavin reductase family protein [Arthrobacter sp. V1I7]MDQ0823786.1 flavin reductase (DIM6/NTAB) family NADH-FMN oxidoreductase RutF [Arthrobacter sp. V1I7]
MTVQKFATKTSSPGDRGTILMKPNDPITADEFKLAFRNYPGGVAVITADAGDGPVGLTATSVTSVNLDPPLLMFSISDLSSSTPTIRRADTVVVHLLGADQLHLAKLCATSGIDRFEDTSLWTRLATGEPLFRSAHTWIRGSIVNTLEAGASTIVVVQAQEASVSVSSPADNTEEEALVYHNRAWHALGPHSKIE